MFDSVDPARINRRLADLSDIGATSDDGITRPAYSKEESEAFEYIQGELTQEYTAREDATGNVFATREPDAERSIFTGSHLDSVFNGGYLDGALGVITALEAIDAVYESNLDPVYPPTLAIFRAEESARFGHHTIGSRAALGMIEIDTFAALDQNGIPLWQAMQEAGFQPNNLSEPSIDLDRVAAFFETHIEQGRLLEEDESDVGVVSGIRAPVRYEFAVGGDYDHSGATPMRLRRDAVVAASEMIVAIEELATTAADEGDLVGTVGSVNTVDGSINQVCGRVEFPLDLRSNDVEFRDRVESTILDELASIAAAHDVELTETVIDRSQPVQLDPGAVTCLEEAARDTNSVYQVLSSGGGHDAMNFQLNGTPTGMLFAPSIDGISHNPAEETTDAGIAAVTRTLARGLVEFGKNGKY
jgi:hydantoinase/carbamoylase family amidase